MGLGQGQNGVMVEVSRLVGFCLLIRRELIDAIGLLDEQFGIGCFEDDDYCLRAIAAGFRAVIAGDAFVHHFGSRTFLGSGVDAGAAREPSGDFWKSGRGMVGRGPPPGRRRGARVPARAGAVRSGHRARGRAAAAARPQTAQAFALHDRARQRQDIAALPREHPAVGRRDDRGRHRFGRRDAANRRIVWRSCIISPGAMISRPRETNRCAMPPVIGCSGWIPTIRSRPNAGTG